VSLPQRETGGASFGDAAMAKIIFHPEEHLVEIDVLPPGQGEACVRFNPQDKDEIRNALSEIGIKMFPVNCRLIAATCDIELTTDDLKHLHQNPHDPILLNGGPFGIYVSLKKTPLDYLDETQPPHQL
jgi:hypothetical protein